jgi:uncharacterized protein with HEPN domain
MADDLTRDAVSRCFGIIGEATTHIPKEVIADHSEIPWAEMRGMRNIVVHEYFGVTDETLWKTAREDLPTIIEPLRKLLADGCSPCAPPVPRPCTTGRDGPEREGRRWNGKGEGSRRVVR